MAARIKAEYHRVRAGTCGQVAGCHVNAVQASTQPDKRKSEVPTYEI
jgi:hypothetical protein